MRCSIRLRMRIASVLLPLIDCKRQDSQLNEGNELIKAI